MKQCPFCAESIQDAAIVCRFCNRELPATEHQPPQSPSAAQKQPRQSAITFIAVLGAVMILAIVARALQGDARPATASVKPGVATERRAMLQLLAGTGQRSSDSYMSVEGQVKNVSGHNLTNIEVVVTWYTKDRAFVRSDSALIEYNPILPDQTAPFRVLSSRNPEMDRFSIDFKTLGGGLINMEDKRSSP